MPRVRQKLSAARYAFDTFTAHTLYSGHAQMLSNESMVSQFAFPSSKWNGIQVSPGFVLSDTRAVEWMA